MADSLARRRAKAPPLNNFNLDENLPIQQLKREINKIIKASKPSGGGTIITIGPVSLSWVPELKEGVIDVMPLKGDLGPIATTRQLKAKFDHIRAALPANTTWGLNANKVGKHNIYKRWFANDSQVTMNKPGDEMFQKADNPGFRLDTGKQQLWAGGAVPDHIARPKFEEYMRSVDEKIATGAKRAKGQFKHKGMYYTFVSQGKNAKSIDGLLDADGTPFKVVSNKDIAVKEANRRAKKYGATPKMNPWEWQSIDELYDYAGRMGYHVDHIKPLEKGGSHHWKNLQVLDAEDNLVKGVKETFEGQFKPKMKSQLTEGPFTLEDWGKWNKRIETVENAKEVEALRNISPKNVGAAGFGAELAASSGRGTLQRRLGTILPVVGAGFDAWDVQQRYQEMMDNPNEGFTDWLDKAQFGIATTTLGTSFWNEPANFALGMANLGIDVGRTIFEEDKREEFFGIMRNIGSNTTKLSNQLFKTYL